MNKLNTLAAKVHAANHQWWHDINTGLPIERNKGELLMLVITELAEACEGIRKNLMDDKLPHRRMEEVEMADAYIRLLDYAGGFGIELKEIDPEVKFVPENKGQALLNICGAVVNAGGISVVGDVPNDFWIYGALAMIEGYCLKFHLDLDAAVTEKMAYNATRADHTAEASRLANGKKF